jgi:hypothetical protein
MSARPDSRRTIRAILSDVLDSEDNVDNSGEVFTNISRRNMRPIHPPRLAQEDFIRAYREMRSAINRTTQPDPVEQSENEQQVQAYGEPGKKIYQSFSEISNLT